MLDPDDVGRIVAIFDWEMATIGSTPTIADRPLMVCSARKASRTARGLALGVTFAAPVSSTLAPVSVGPLVVFASCDSVTSPVTVETVIETADFHVNTIGDNLPNENEIREKYGSKSFLFTGSSRTLRQGMGFGPLEEFAASPDEIAPAFNRGKSIVRTQSQSLFFAAVG